MPQIMNTKPEAQKAMLCVVTQITITIANKGIKGIPAEALKFDSAISATAQTADQQIKRIFKMSIL